MMMINVYPKTIKNWTKIAPELREATSLSSFLLQKTFGVYNYVFKFRKNKQTFMILQM